MANEPENNINTFLENIPGLIAEAHRQMFSDNINVIECIQRRVESSLRFLDNRCQNGLYDRLLEENIGTLVTTNNGGPKMTFRLTFLVLSKTDEKVVVGDEDIMCLKKV